MNVLVLSGGGVFGALHLGALHKKVNKYRVISGTSVGAIIGALLAVGYEPLELLRVMPDTGLITPDIQLVGFGAASQEPLTRFIETLLKEKCDGQLLTFREVHTRFDVDLVVTGTCLDTQRSEYFHRHSHPHMSVIDALRISCCVPLLFPHIQYKGKTYVDGFVTDNFPLAFTRTYVDTYFPEKEVEILIHAQNIVHRAMALTATGTKDTKDTTCWSTFHGYIQTLFRIFLDSKSYDYGDVPVLELAPKTGVNMMKYTQHDLERLFNEGYETT
jgi:NTE family protein